MLILCLQPDEPFDSLSVRATDDSEQQHGNAGLAGQSGECGNQEPADIVQGQKLRDCGVWLVDIHCGTNLIVITCITTAGNAQLADLGNILSIQDSRDEGTYVADNARLCFSASVTWSQRSQSYIEYALDQVCDVLQ